MKVFDVIIIGGGQSALACAYFLQRSSLTYVILDDQSEGGGAWLHTWDSLTLFSPSEYSSLPGWMMPKSSEKFPLKNEVIEYLKTYEKRYDIKIKRTVEVISVHKRNTDFELITSNGVYYSKTVISATGTLRKPFIPNILGIDIFKGVQIHSADYKNADYLFGKKVLVVGNGNSGAQILAEVSKVTSATWAVNQLPEFLPDDVDGRVLFDVASAKYHAIKSGKEFDASKYSLGKIVMVPSLIEARNRNALNSRPSFKELTQSGVIWQNNEEESFDVIIWSTGFKFATDHLKSLDVVDESGKIETEETRSIKIPGLYLVGYGNWTGFASATLIGVGRSAKSTINHIVNYIQ